MSVQNNEFSEAVEIIRKALQDMEFGSVTIMVQDGRLVSIENTEKFKVKLNNKTDRNAGGFILISNQSIDKIKDFKIRTKPIYASFCTDFLSTLR